MKSRLSALLVVAGLLIGSTSVVQGAAQTVEIAETSSFRVSNFRSWYYRYTNNPIRWQGFGAEFVSYYHALPTIEPKLRGSSPPYSTPSANPSENSLLFDCHAGYATLGDYALAVPLGMIGEEPYCRAEFDWSSSTNESDSRYLCLQIACEASRRQVVWQMRPGLGYRTGHAVVEIPNIPNLTVSLAVLPVPEPGPIAGLCLGFASTTCAGVLGWLRRDNRRG